MQEANLLYPIQELHIKFEHKKNPFRMEQQEIDSKKISMKGDTYLLFMYSMAALQAIGYVFLMEIVPWQPLNIEKMHGNKYAHTLLSYSVFFVPFLLGAPYVLQAAFPRKEIFCKLPSLYYIHC